MQVLLVRGRSHGVGAIGECRNHGVGASSGRRGWSHGIPYVGAIRERQET